MKEHLKQLIESILDDVLLEFKTNFKLNEFKKLETPKEILNYASENLPILGEGSSRIVFRYPNSGYVLKVAKNKAGVAQNKAEVDVFTTPNMKKIVADIAEFDDDYYWVVSEAVREFTNEEEFFKRTGVISESRFFKVVYYVGFHVGVHEARNEMPLHIRSFFQANKGNKWLENFIQAASTNPKMITGDVEHLSHWGVTSSGNVVLLDYGLNREVYEKHYGSESEGLKRFDVTFPGEEGDPEKRKAQSDIATRNIRGS